MHSPAQCNPSSFLGALRKSGDVGRYGELHNTHNTGITKIRCHGGEGSNPAAQGLCLFKIGLGINFFKVIVVTNIPSNQRIAMQWRSKYGRLDLRFDIHQARLEQGDDTWSQFESLAF